MAKTICLEFTRTEDWIIDAILELGEFLLKSQRLIQSGIVLGNSPDSNRRNQEHDEERFQKGVHPDVDDNRKKTWLTIIPESNAVLQNDVLLN